MHVWGYASAVRESPRAEFAGIWDEDESRRNKLAANFQTTPFTEMDHLLARCDAVIITSENSRHAELATAAANAGRHILCEKPLVITEEQGMQMLHAVLNGGVKLMTAFPCRFSPAYRRLKERVAHGEIGQVKAICATNRGRCPFDWFVEKDKSGGGSMIDHVVHVADLLRDLLGQEVVSVHAQTGNNMYGKDWEDTAMLTLEFPGGLFATLDSSWSRPSSYKTWGDVTMNVVGEKGAIEMDMFGQSVDVYTNEDNRHNLFGYGSNLDSLLVDAFFDCLDGAEAVVSGFDGLQAARIALAGYESARTRRPVAPRTGLPLT